MVQSIWQCAVYANDERVSDDATRILISTCNEDNWDSHLQSVCFLSEKELDVKTLPEVKIECGKNSNIEKEMIRKKDNLRATLILFTSG